MKIYPRRKRLFKIVTIVWIFLFFLNTGFVFYYIKEPAWNLVLFISLLILIFFKSFFNAVVSYPEALRGELVFGNKMAELMFVFRKLFKTKTEK